MTRRLLYGKSLTHRYLTDLALLCREQNEKKKKKKKKKKAEGEKKNAIGCGPKNAGKSSCNTVRRHETHVAFCRKRSTVILNSATEKIQSQ